MDICFKPAYIRIYIAGAQRSYIYLELIYLKARALIYTRIYIVLINTRDIYTRYIQIYLNISHIYRTQYTKAKYIHVRYIYTY